MDSILDLLKTKNEKKLQALILARIPETGLISKEDDLLLSYIGMDPAEVTPYSIRYSDGFEYSENYTFQNGRRVPTGYTVTPLAVLNKTGVKVLECLPIKKLVIDGGRYPYYYKMQRLGTNDTFIANIVDIVKVKKFIPECENFILEYCLYNKIEEVVFS